MIRKFIILALVATFIMATPYERLNYESVLSTLNELAKNNPDIIKVKDGANEYKKYMNEVKCGDTICKYPIVTLTNFDSSYDEINSRPQTLLVGSIHGDEIVGTNTLVRFLEWSVK